MQIVLGELINSNRASKTCSKATLKGKKTMCGSRWKEINKQAADRSQRSWRKPKKDIAIVFIESMLDQFLEKQKGNWIWKRQEKMTSGSLLAILVASASELQWILLTRQHLSSS